MISIRNLHKSFGTQVVLSGVNLDIEDGKTLAIVGPSGVGKSVLIKLIMGILQPEAGEVLINGESITAAKSEAQRNRIRASLGVLFQSAALFDSLTDLPNRANFNERLGKELELARRGEASGVVLFIDLDDLKMVNDTYGHTYGDDIIVAAGNRIVAETSEDAFVARIGGDEFIVILPGANDRQQVIALSNRIIKAIGAKFEIAGTPFHMTASIGIAAYPADGDSSEEIVKNAENAMYAAKREGKNCWRFYTPDMQAERMKR